jgi:hypothetical protein
MKERHWPLVAGSRLKECIETHIPKVCLLGPLWRGQPPFGSDQEKGISSFPNRRLPTQTGHAKLINAINFHKSEEVFGIS